MTHPDDRPTRAEAEREAEYFKLQESKWWETHDNLVTLTAWMAENQFEASEVARAVEKPWNYTDEFMSAREAEHDE
jgi:hypothetical protein